MEAKVIQTLKKIYYQEKVSEHAVFVGWENLKHHLPEQEIPKPLYRKHRNIFACATLFLLIGSVGFVQSATPNHPLYSLKVAMDNTVAKVLGKPEIAIDNRTNDVNRAVKQEPKALPAAVSAYKKTMQQSTDVTKQQNTEQKNAYKQNLSVQENKLKSITPTSSADKYLLNTAISQTEQAKQAVKGTSTMSNDNYGNGNGNSSSNGNANQNSSDNAQKQHNK